MKLLLDTHIWIWSVLHPEQLAVRVAKALEDPDSELWLSPLSLWELLLLVERGRFALDLPFEEWIHRTLAEGIWREAAVSHQVILQAPGVRLSHRDPVDRLLAATAIVDGLTLVTADERLLRVRGLPTLANR